MSKFNELVKSMTATYGVNEKALLVAEREYYEGLEDEYIPTLDKKIEILEYQYSSVMRIIRVVDDDRQQLSFSKSYFETLLTNCRTLSLLRILGDKQYFTDECLEWLSAAEENIEAIKRGLSSVSTSCTAIHDIEASLALAKNVKSLVEDMLEFDISFLTMLNAPVKYKTKLFRVTNKIWKRIKESKSLIDASTASDKTLVLTPIKSMLEVIDSRKNGTIERFFKTCKKALEIAGNEVWSVEQIPHL